MNDSVLFVFAFVFILSFLEEIFLSVRFQEISGDSKLSSVLLFAICCLMIITERI